MLRLYLFLCLLSQVLASPVPIQHLYHEKAASQVTLQENSVTCETVDKYTTEWFLNNVQSEYRDSFTNTALFYSRGMSEQAIKFAKSHGLATIWDVWPCKLYIYHDEPSNPMRCIHATPDLRTAFYGNMSKAFAIKAGGLATVMHSTDDYDEPPKDGIWATIELPTMKELSTVALIKKIDPAGVRSQVFWRRFGELWAAASNAFRTRPPVTGRARSKRSLWSSDYCLAPSEYKFFDSIKW